jgi:uncharacterized protein (DUF1501 family)
MDSFYRRAYDMISSKEAREAFDLSKEPDALKEKYGKTGAGMTLLLARRLAEAGVRFVSVMVGSWDHHGDLKTNLEKEVPPLDRAFPALIEDLESRGLLDSTLVLLTTEFGRTPKMNGANGRDHWPKVYSVALAGGGIRKGMVYGSSDAVAAEPDRDPVSIQDFATTVYDRLGIVADKELMAPGNRPIEIVDGGRVIKGILA